MGIANDIERIRRDGAVRAYLETALWAETDPDTEEPLDRDFDIDYFSDEAFMQAAVEIDQFMNDVHALVDQAGRSGVYLGNLALEPEDLMHDFWLTRNRHGAGFWDRPEKYGPLADALTELAHRAGERHVYVKVHGTPEEQESAEYTEVSLEFE